MKNNLRNFLAFVLLLTACSHTPEKQQEPVGPILASEQRPRTDQVEASGSKYSISTQGRASTKAAHAVLAEGGNLIDAAVAATFVISVERPHSTGLSGGGFFMYREAKTGKIYAIDFRERAPLKATEAMFVGADGKPDKELSRSSVLATGVPGIVAGMAEIHQRFGKLPWSRVVRPAIELAENGFPVYPSLEKALQARSDILLKQPYAKAIFARPSGEMLKAGDLLIQKDLAATLREVSKQKRAGFYSGPVAQKILGYMKSNKGLITAADLKSYKVHWREPVRSHFSGYEIVSMPPPSSGGVHVIQFLSFLEGDRLSEKGFLSADSIHLASASLQSAFADRAQYVGDPDFVKVPVQGLISKDYLALRRKDVSLDKARSAEQVRPGQPAPFESSDTTHMSMMDAEGNMISTTQTINGWMGSGLMVPGTGLLLNNEMDDFSAQEGSRNMFEAIGGKANSVQPRKTPLSSMAPTLVLKENLPVLAVGAPGGTRIISCVAQTILNVLEFKLPLYESVSSIRYHHQWQPDVLQIDPPGPSAKALKELRNKGYKVDLKPIGCNVMAVSRETSPETNGILFKAVSDPRDIGTSYAE